MLLSLVAPLPAGVGRVGAECELAELVGDTYSPSSGLASFESAAEDVADALGRVRSVTGRDCEGGGSGSDGPDLEGGGELRVAAAGGPRPLPQW